MNVLLALDGSPAGESAAAAIAAWARESGAHITLFSVLRPEEIHETVSGSGYTHTLTPQGTPSGQLLHGVSGPRSRTAEDRTQALERASAERSAYLAGVARTDLDGVETAVLVEDANDIPGAIVDAAGATGADFVAMATRARSPLGQAMFGAVHEEVLRESPIPVLLVGPGARRLHAPVDVARN